MPKLKPERPTFVETFMVVAKVVAQRATCPRLSVGAVLAIDNRIIATGYNGSPSGLPHCSEVGCMQRSCPVCAGWRDRLDYTKCDYCKGTGKVGGCSRTIHAEANALIQCAKYGRATEGAKAYLTHRPCVACAGLLITAGLTEVTFDADYTSDGLDGEVRQMFAAARVKYLGYRTSP